MHYNKSVFLAVSSKCCDTSLGGPSPSEFRALIAEMEEFGFRVTCPLATMNWDGESLPEDPVGTIAQRLRLIDEADHVVAFPVVGNHVSGGIMLLIGIAFERGKPLTIVLGGADAFDSQWQLAGLSRFSRGDEADNPCDLLFYTGSVAHCWPRLRASVLRQEPDEGASHSSSGTGGYGHESKCPFGPNYEPYWRCRYELFRKWDGVGGEGIRTDHIGLCSVKPESIAQEIAHSLSGSVVLDAFAGVGGVSIALAASGKKVIAVESDKNRCHMLRHNAAIYGVADRIEIVNEDVCDVYESFEYDAIYLDPSWGGPRYRDKEVFGFRHFKIGKGRSTTRILKELIGRSISKGGEVAFTIPNNFDFPALARMHREWCLHDRSQAGRTLKIQWGKSGDRVLFMTVFL